MDTEYFFYVDKTAFRHLRPATAVEQEWYHSLSQELQTLQKNIDRFERVDDSFSVLSELLKDSKQNIAQLERSAKRTVADFLYSFNECLDHWNAYITRNYGNDSDYYRRYKELTSRAFDGFDEYKITYALRNFQHIDDVLDDISIYLGASVKIYANKQRILASFQPTAKQRSAFEKLPDRFELYPIFEVAKNQLEMIEKRLMFYTVTAEQESKAIYALKFKEQLCGAQGILLLGKLLDERGNELEATDETFLRLSLNQEKFTLTYQDEIPWGVCKLLQQFQGTDYQNF